MAKSLFLIALFAYSLFLIGSNRASVSPVDGFIRASMARNIIESGSLYPPLFPSKPMVDHPPLYIWSIAASFKVFGINDFAAVFPGRLFGFLTVFATFWLGLLLGMPQRAALLGALILTMTRDFVLISVQGGIEPLFTLTSILAVCFILLKNKTPALNGFIAGALIVATAFSKGPPALWPFIFIPLLLFLRRKQELKWSKKIYGYLAGLILFSSIWAIWIKTSGLGWYWSWYWNEQVVGSALKGRGQLQVFEPFYFTKILLLHYWPWLPVLIAALFVTAKNSFIKRDLLNADVVIFIFSFGFFAGFSMVSWKFWYYIAPCFPGFALLCGNQIYKWGNKKINGFKIFTEEAWQRKLILLCSFWIFTASVFPIQLSSHRPQEVHDFKNTLLHSLVEGPVWFVDHLGDHNMFKTAGFWYFHREVIQVADKTTYIEFENALKKPAWILTSTSRVNDCSKFWCKDYSARWDSNGSTLLLTK